jgi:hypothetical protein
MTDLSTTELNQTPTQSQKLPRGRLLQTAEITLLVALMMSALAHAADVPPGTLSDVSFATFSGAFEWGRTYPVVSNGYLLSFMRINISGPGIPIVVYPLSNQTRQDLSFTSMGTRTTIADMAVTVNQQLLVAGTYTTVVSSQEASSAHFIAQVDMKGNALNTFNLGQYDAERICATGDGTFWTLGPTTDSTGTNDANAGMLRHYGSDGTLRQSYLPASSLPNPQGGLNLHAAGTLFGVKYPQAFLGCGPSTVGVYIGAPENIWVEVDQATGASRQWTVPDSSNVQMTSMVLASKHLAYASVAARGLIALTVDDGGGSSWSAVPEAPGNATPVVGAILGTDKGSVVYARGAQAKPGDRPLYWGVVK